MKILHMILSMTGGGAERQLTHIAPELSGRGHDVHVAFVVPGVNWARLAGQGCTIHHFAASRKWKPLVFAQSISLVRRLRPDVLQTWLTHMDIVGGVTARVLRVPWVMSERCAALLYPPTILNRLRVAAAKHADLIVPNSEGGAEYWIGQGIDAARLEIVPNFVPLAEIDATAPLDDERVSAGDELVVYVGRLAPEKNLHTLVRAFEHVARLRPRARFAFCGDGPLLSNLTAQVEAAGMRERFIFTGFVNNVASWLKRASAAVAVSRTEGHPNAMLEAIVAGVPVVVSDIPAYRSVLDEQSASFVAGDDAQAIAAAVMRTLEDGATAQERAAHARTRLSLQSLEATASRYEEVYRRAIAHAASRRLRVGAVKA
jgi:glycosyltransferase involved in cell wall biosynthesis